jgi:carbonic anhydrase
VKKVVPLICALFIASVLCVCAAEKAPQVTADQAWKHLMDGNGRYVSATPKHPNQGFDVRNQTANQGQHPFAAVLSCSDSRVPVEVLFDRGVGDIFVIRVAGNVAGVNEMASIEYAVEHLNVPLVVTLGHSKCGAVTAAAENAHAQGHLPHLLRAITPAVCTVKAENPKLTGHAFVDAAIKANVFQQMEDLLNASHAIRENAKKGTIKLLGAYYHIDTGKVVNLGEHPKKAALLKDPQGH